MAPSSMGGSGWSPWDGSAPSQGFPSPRPGPGRPPAFWANSWDEACRMPYRPAHQSCSPHKTCSAKRPVTRARLQGGWPLPAFRLCPFLWKVPSPARLCPSPWAPLPTPSLCHHPSNTFLERATTGRRKGHPWHGSRSPVVSPALPRPLPLPWHVETESLSSLVRKGAVGEQESEVQPRRIASNRSIADQVRRT